MSSPPTPPPTSIFNTPDDPRADTALPPWLWLPLTFLMVVCILYVSLRRAHSMELLGRGREWINQHLPFLSPHPSGNIRLAPHDLSSSSFSLHQHDSDSDSDSELPTTRSSGGVDTSDELPLPYRRQGAWGVATEMGSSALELGKRGWEGLGWGREGGGGRRGEGERDDGIAKAFWGTRRENRVGGIRLGDAGSAARRGGGGGAGQGGLSGFSGLLERVTDVAGSRRPPSQDYSPLPFHAAPPPATSRRTAPPSPSSRSHSRAASISSSSNGGLFELGEEDEEGHADATELPREFELVETRRPRIETEGE